MTYSDILNLGNYLNINRNVKSKSVDSIMEKKIKSMKEINMDINYMLMLWEQYM
jgi:hypothetical protein